MRMKVMGLDMGKVNFFLRGGVLLVLVGVLAAAARLLRLRPADDRRPSPPSHPHLRPISKYTWQPAVC